MTVKLADLLGKGPVVLYTSWTRRRRLEQGGRRLRGGPSQFEAANARVVGVSADPVAKLSDFTEDRVKHLLLSNADREILPAYGVMRGPPGSHVPPREAAYLILDHQGVVHFVPVQAATRSAY